jgi:protein NRD1
MAFPAVQELDSILQSLTTLKPPGVNKAKVDGATKLCMDPSNASVRNSIVSVLSLTSIRQIEAALVDSLINGFRSSPVSHKLGVLYIVDSITRQWAAAGAIHAGGIRKMTDALPYILNEYLSVVPENQKVSCIVSSRSYLTSQ